MLSDSSIEWALPDESFDGPAIVRTRSKKTRRADDLLQRNGVEDVAVFVVPAFKDNLRDRRPDFIAHHSSSLRLLTRRSCICNNRCVGTKLKVADLEDMVTGCLMNRARLVSRFVTGIYEDELRGLGLRGSQLNVLAAIAYMGSVRRSELAKVLHIDISTLTRNLRVMETNEWIVPVADRSDGRAAPIRITKAGENVLARATPLWRNAQRRMSEILGPHGRMALITLSDGFAAS